MDLKQFAIDVHENAVRHGWYAEPRTFGDELALIHSEVSEVLEEFRNGHEFTETYYTCKAPGHDCTTVKNCGRNEEIRTCNNGCSEKYGKPEGIPAELADIIIRVLDVSEAHGIDIEAALIEKHEFNKTRPYKHGNKVI